MKIRVNGETREIESSLTLDGLLDTLKLRKQAVVCELNRSIVNKAQYSETYLRDNDSLEIVHFVGGG